MSVEYWMESFPEIADRAGVSLSEEQVASIAEMIAGAESVKTEYTGESAAAHPSVQESEDLEGRLKLEKNYPKCQECGGSGVQLAPCGTSRWATTPCDRCSGHGRINL